MYFVTKSYSVSHATMRPEDLILRLFEHLEELQNNSLTSPANDGDEVRAKDRCARITARLADIEGRMLDEEGETKSEYFEDFDAWHYDLEALFDLLGEFAGPGFMFGAQEGDGSDYGFWECDPEEEEEEEGEPDDYEDNDDSFDADACSACGNVNGTCSHAC